MNRIFALGLIFYFAVTGALLAEGGKCQILDVKVEPQYEVGAVYIPESDFAGHGSTEIIEPYADWTFAYFHKILNGDINMSLRFHSKVFVDDADINLPYQVAKLAVDSDWTWRFEGGTALRIRLAPGIYSDFEDLGSEDIYMPFSMALIHSFHTKLSGMAGFEIRPDFRREIMPIIGLAWEVSDSVRFDARLPESKLIIYPNKNFNVYAGFAWNNTSYNLNDPEGQDREQLTVEDYRLYGGLTVNVSTTFQINAEAGSIFNRTAQFGNRDSDTDEIDIDRARFFKVALACPL